MKHSFSRRRSFDKLLLENFFPILLMERVTVSGKMISSGSAVHRIIKYANPKYIKAFLNEFISCRKEIKSKRLVVSKEKQERNREKNEKPEKKL